MRRIVYGVLLLLTTAPALVAPDTLRSREDYLRHSWENFTPGAVSAPVSAVWYDATTGAVSGRRSWTLALLTEDRHLRLFDIEGENVLELRVALRAAADLLQERSGAVILVDRFGTLRRVNLRTGTITEVIRTGLDSRRAWIDRQGNFYMVSESGEIAHVSAAGRLMWRRSVPTPVHSVNTGAGELLVAPGDGTVLRFDSDGRGRVVVRGDEPFLEIRIATVRGRSLLAGVDAAGVLSVFERDSPGGRRLWSVPVGRGSSIGAIDDEGRSWVTTPDERLLLVDESGATKIELDLPGVHPDRVAVDTRRMKAYVVDGDNRIRTIGSGGRVEAALQLRQTPQTLDYVPETGELVARYENWLLEVFRTTGRSLPVEVPGGARSQPERDDESPGALRTLAASVLESPSERDRVRLLDDLDERMRAAELYGQVSTVRSVLIDIATEVYSVSMTRRGADPGGKDFPAVRLRAVELLGFFADVASRDALTQAVTRDPDPTVAARALRLLAETGNDEFNALERGYQRFRGAGEQERSTLASGLVVLLEVLNGDDAVQAEASQDRIRQIAMEIAASSVSEDLRRRAMSAAGRNSRRD
jgi:hypothetical protein